MSQAIMLIRHAEKPVDGSDGVTELGRPDAGSLSVSGWKRAGALVPYFAGLPDRSSEAELCRPAHVFAARPTSFHRSSRPLDTVSALATRLGLSVDQRWAAEDSPVDIARALKAMSGPVLMCWRHDYLPALARAIWPGHGVPERWPGTCFDITWLFHEHEGILRFRQVPQLLFATDRTEPLSC